MNRQLPNPLLRLRTPRHQHRPLRFRPATVQRREAFVRDVTRIVRRVPRLLIQRRFSQAFWVQFATAPGLRTRETQLLRRERSESRIVEHLSTSSAHTRLVLREQHARVLQTVMRMSAAATVTKPTPAGRIESRHVYPQLSTSVVRASAPAPPRALPSPPRVTAEPRADERLVPHIFHRSAEVIPLPPQELNRVADHVIQELDRRVLSYRERTGQV